MNTMTLVNIHIKDDEKKKLKDYVEKHTDTSMSNYVRGLINERMEMDDMIHSVPDPVDVEIPDYIPKNQYVVFVNGAVVAVGDNPSDLADIALIKFPNYPFVMKFNGTPLDPMEYAFMSLAEWKVWKYATFQGHSYPLILVSIELSNETKQFSASLDTAASVCIIKEGILD